MFNSFLSHPVWVRGLKLIYTLIINVILLSHPVWVRGLKRLYPLGKGLDGTVAPRVGAWIETLQLSVFSSSSSSSHPVWVRGLKHNT